MKRTSLLLSGLLAVALTMPGMVLANDAHHPEQANAPAVTQSKAPKPEQTVKKMQGNVKKMQAQLERLGRTKNEAEFQKLMAEHMQTMHENMTMAEGMVGTGCNMMEHHDMRGMIGGGMMADHEAMMQRMQSMEKRMDRMEQGAKPASSQ